MSRLHAWWSPTFLTASLVGCWIALAPAAMIAQTPDDTKINVVIDTLDDVKLNATFYKGPKGAESPVAVLIPRFNSDRNKGGWDALARELQSKLNFAVLVVDLRGHGTSTTVKDNFWNYPHNKNGIRNGYNAKNKSTLTVADFKSSYWPILFNDLIAVRHYLDIENDAQRCNSSSIFIIAAQESAGLGMGWLAYEYDRLRVEGGASALVNGITYRNPGEDVTGAIWLGPVQRGSGVSISFRPTEWFGRPSASKLREHTPMYFLYGKQDTASASVVPSYLAAVKKAPDGKTSKSHSLDKEEGLATKVAGQDLLGPSAATLNVNEKIVKYLQAVIDKQGTQPWKAQNPGPMQLFPLGPYGYQPPI